AGTDANGQIQECARRIAEAQVDLHRVRYARHQVLSGALSNQHYDSHSNVGMRIKLLRKILRGKAPGMSMSDMSIEAPTKNLTSMPAGPQKFALILSQEAKQLLAMDRYERRALYGAILPSESLMRRAISK